MTNIHASPAQGRPWVSSRRAAQLLRRDARTVRNMVRDGDLDGGRQEAGTWFVYTDQPLFATKDASNLVDENARLVNENAQLRARAEAAEEANRVLLTTQATLLGALADYQQGTDSVSKALEAERERSDLYYQAAQSYRRSSDSLTAVVSAFRDLSATNAIPDDLSGMINPPST